MAVQLALALKENEDQGVSFFSNLRGLILDCCPGDDTFHRAYSAARMSVPETTIAQLLDKALLYPTVTVVNRLQHAGLLRSVRDLRALLNDPGIFGSRPRRLYIYSKEDVMVGWQDVQIHVEDARSRGYDADQVVFERGPHCGLIIEDPDRYWTAVQKFWNHEDLPELAEIGNSTSSTLLNSGPKPTSHRRSRL